MKIVISEQQLRYIISEQPESRFVPKGMTDSENVKALSGGYERTNEDTPIVEYPAPWRGNIQIPKDSTNIVLWSDNDDRLKWYGVRKEPNGRMVLGNEGLTAPSEEYMRQILPTNTLKNFVTTKDNKKWYLIITNDGKGWKVKQNYFSSDPKNPKKAIAYNPETYIYVSVSTIIKTWFEEHWVDIAIIVVASLTGSIVGAIFGRIVGAQVAGAEMFNVLGWQMTNRAFAAYLGEAGVWMGSAAWNAYKGNNASAAIDMFFGLILPGLHGVGLLKWGIKATDEVIVSTATKVVGKTPQELEMLMTKSTAEGGLNSLEKELVETASKLPKETIENMTKDLMAKANANIKSKGINLAKNKVIVQVSELLQKSKVGAFLRKKWYTWVPTVLVHDMFFIHLVNKINEHFGIINQSVITKMAEGYSKLKTDEEKEMFMTKTNKVLEKTNNLQEFESKISKGELNVTKIDTSNVDRDSKTNAIKLKPGYDSPNYYDSLNNVYKQ